MSKIIPMHHCIMSTSSTNMYLVRLLLLILLHRVRIEGNSSHHQCCTSHRIPSNWRRMLKSNEAELITTTACSQVRNRKEYNARVDFTYLYSFQYTQGILNVDDRPDDTPMLLLRSIERAIATSIASTLVQCTTNNQYPLYAVDVAPSLVGSNNASSMSKHIIVPPSYDTNYTNDMDTFACPHSSINTSSNDSTVMYKCITALGMTSILFRDNDSTSASTYNGTPPSLSEMDWTLIDTLIAATIEDEYYLNQFILTNSIMSGSKTQLIQTRYDRSIGNNIILSPFNNDDLESSGNGSVKVAILAAVLSFSITVLVLSFIVCYFRCFTLTDGRHRSHRSGSKNQGSSQKRFRRQRPDLYTFEPLDDELQYSDSNDPTLVPTGWMVVTRNDNHNEARDVHPNHAPTSTQQQQQQQHEYELPSTGRYVATAWSDLTSDSESIMSSLHLDRIDEVDEEMGDYSYEHQPYDIDVNDLEVSNTKSLSKEENIEVSLKKRVQSRPPNTHPSCPSLDFVEDWKVSYEPSDTACTNSEGQTPQDQSDTQAIANLSIEISIDDEIIVSMNDTDETNHESFAFPNGLVEDSFTFPSDDDSDRSHRDHTEQSIKHQTSTSVEEKLPSGHIYDADDFQSIEISVVWMDSETLDCENTDDDDEEEEEDDEVQGKELEIISTELGTNDASAILEVAMSQSATKVTEDEHESFERHTRHFTNDQPAVLAVASQPEMSALTDSDKLVLPDSTESTLFTDDNPESFSSSNAYRSVLDKVSYPAHVNEESHTQGSSGSTGSTNDENDEDGYERPADRHSNTAMAYWARDVLMKLMSDSPKMLQCDQSNHENDFDSYQSSDAT